jgi:serum response factor
MQVSSGPSFPITNYLAPISASSNVNGTVLKTTGVSGGQVMQLPSGFTFMSGTYSRRDTGLYAMLYFTIM